MKCRIFKILIKKYWNQLIRGVHGKLTLDMLIFEELCNSCIGGEKREMIGRLKVK